MLISKQGSTNYSAPNRKMAMKSVSMTFSQKAIAPANPTYPQENLKSKLSPSG